MAKKKEVVEPIIHIKAESDLYSVNGLFPQSKCVKMLEEIRDNFMKARGRHGSRTGLKVQTCVHNPTLFA